MIISAKELKEHITTDKADSVLEDKLQALELAIRKHTNNRFHQIPLVRVKGTINGGVVSYQSFAGFKAGDTVQVTVGDRAEDCGLYTIKTATSTSCTFNEDIPDIAVANITKVKYPLDVKMGVVNMMEWDLKNRDKVGIQSETISRHSVTYFNMDGDNSTMGYPKSLLGFLKPYMKARF